MRALYIALAIGLILIISAFSLNYWERYYPLYLEVYDINYHLAASVGMDRAGGLTMTSFWQYAPHQEPMYYPPFFQLCGLLLLRQGVDINFLAKYLVWMLYPMALFSLWFFMCSSFGSRAGFYSLMLYSLPPLLMEKIWGHPPFGVVCVLIPLVFLSLFKRRYIAALILALLGLATHLSAGIILPVLLIYALHSRLQRKPIFILLGFLALSGLPFFWIIVKRVSFLGGFSFLGVSQFLKAITATGAFRTFFDYRGQYYVYLGILGALGAVTCYFRKGRFLLFPSVFIALLLAKNIADAGGAAASFRYIQMLPMVFFPMMGGIFLDAAHGRLGRVRFLGRALVVKSLAILFIMIVGAYALFYGLSGLAIYNRTPAIVFLNRPEIWLPYKLLFTMEQRARLLRLVEGNVKEDEMIYNSAGANLGSHLSAFSRRSLTRDIGAWPKMLVKQEGLPGYRLLEKMNPQFNVYVLEDASRAGKVTVPKPLVTIKQLKMIFMALGALILIDLFIPRRGKSRRPI